MLRGLFKGIAKDEYNASPVSDSTFMLGDYDVNFTQYLMQDTVTLTEISFARGNYVYYWMAQYVGEPTQEIEAFLYDWEMLPWDEPSFETYNTDNFSILLGKEIEVNGENLYDKTIDSLTVYSSFEPNSGIVVRVYQYDFAQFAHFQNVDSLIAYFNFWESEGRLISRQDTTLIDNYGYTTIAYRDSAYNLNEVNRIVWRGNKIYLLEITSPFDLDSIYADKVLASFQTINHGDFNFFESKIDTILLLAQSSDSTTFHSVKGVIEDYPLYGKDIEKLKNAIKMGLPLDSDSWDSPGTEILERIAELEGDMAFQFMDSIFKDASIYESAVLSSLQKFGSEKAMSSYRELIGNKKNSLTYSDVLIYLDSLDFLLSDLPQVMQLFQNSENQKVIASVLMSHLNTENNLKIELKPYASQFLESFKNTADTLDLEDEYNWNSYFLSNLFDINMAIENNPKLLAAECNTLLKAASPSIKMTGLLGLLHLGKPLKRKVIQDVLKHEEYADFLLERIVKTGNVNLVSKYLDMETIARIYLKSYLAYEDYYDVETTFLEEFEKEINDTTYVFYVFSYEDAYEEGEMVGFTAFEKLNKKLNFTSLYTDIYMGLYSPQSFKDKKEEVLSDFKTYYLDVAQ